jgi:hypothetical protein
VGIDDELKDVAKALPQYDVPERVTQNILAAVELESKRPLLGHYNLLVPVGVACGAISLTLLPVDTLEGFGATAIAVAALFLVQLFLRSDKSEDAANVPS